ncbi:unnamed protein product, partial [Choristocarpus tenellus]
MEKIALLSCLVDCTRWDLVNGAGGTAGKGGNKSSPRGGLGYESRTRPTRSRISTIKESDRGWESEPEMGLVLSSPDASDSEEDNPMPFHGTLRSQRRSLNGAKVNSRSRAPKSVSGMQPFGKGRERSKDEESREVAGGDGGSPSTLKGIKGVGGGDPVSPDIVTGRTVDPSPSLSSDREYPVAAAAQGSSGAENPRSPGQRLMRSMPPPHINSTSHCDVLCQMCCPRRPLPPLSSRSMSAASPRGRDDSNLARTGRSLSVGVTEVGGSNARGEAMGVSVPVTAKEAENWRSGGGAPYRSASWLVAQLAESKSDECLG